MAISENAPGRTIFFVSHNMKAIADLCGRVLLIRSGKLYEEVDPKSTIAKYLDDVAAVEERDAVPAVSAARLVVSPTLG